MNKKTNIFLTRGEIERVIAIMTNLNVSRNESLIKSNCEEEVVRSVISVINHVKARNEQH